MPPSDGVLFYAVLRGSARLAGVAETTLELAPGDVVMVVSGEGHALRHAAENRVRHLDYLVENRHADIPPVLTVGGAGAVGARLLCGRLKVDWPHGMRRGSMPPFIRIGADDFGRINGARRVESLQMLSTGSGASAQLTRTAAFMFTIALRKHPQCSVLFRLSTTKDPIARSLQLIDADPGADWSVARLAQRVRMGRSNFAARFAAEVGRTPMDIVTERRMRRAAALLRKDELKIVEISALVGYRSEAAFSRRFSQFFGVSPSQMRQSVQAQPVDADGKLSALEMLIGGGI